MRSAKSVTTSATAAAAPQDVAGLSADLAPREGGRRLGGKRGGEAAAERADGADFQPAERQRERDERRGGGRERPGGEYASPGARPVGARRGQPRERNQGGETGGRAGKKQRRRHEAGRGRGGERLDPQRKDKRERDGAVRSKPAVSHDRQFGGAVAAAAEPVGEIGEAVLVQGAGRRRLGRHRERGGDDIRQPETARERERGGPERADAGARERRGVANAREIRRPGRPAERQAGEELQVLGDVADHARAATGQSAQTNVADAASAITVCPYSSVPHCPTSARAAPRSFGASAMI